MSFLRQYIKISLETINLLIFSLSRRTIASMSCRNSFRLSCLGAPLLCLASSCPSHLLPLLCPGHMHRKRRAHARFCVKCTVMMSSIELISNQSFSIPKSHHFASDQASHIMCQKSFIFGPKQHQNRHYSKTQLRLITLVQMVCAKLQVSKGATAHLNR